MIAFFHGGMDSAARPLGPCQSRRLQQGPATGGSSTDRDDIRLAAIDHAPCYKSVILVPLNRHVRRHRYTPSAVFAEVRSKARPPPIPDTCGSLSPSPGCRIVSSRAAVVSPPPRRHFFASPVSLAVVQWPGLFVFPLLPLGFRAQNSKGLCKCPHFPPFSTASTSNLDQSLERLFGLLQDQVDLDRSGLCRPTAARRPSGWSRDLQAIGFDASVRDTPGHPMVVAHHDGAGRLRRMCCSTAITTCSRSIRSSSGTTTRSSPPSRRSDRPQGHHRPRLRRRQGPVDDLRRGLPRLQGRSTARCPAASPSCSRARRNPARRR